MVRAEAARQGALHAVALVTAVLCGIALAVTSADAASPVAGEVDLSPFLAAPSPDFTPSVDSSNGEVLNGPIDAAVICKSDATCARRMTLQGMRRGYRRTWIRGDQDTLTEEAVEYGTREEAAADVGYAKTTFAIQPRLSEFELSRVEGFGYTVHGEATPETIIGIIFSRGNVEYRVEFDYAAEHANLEVIDVAAQVAAAAPAFTIPPATPRPATPQPSPSASPSRSSGGNGPIVGAVAVALLLLAAGAGLVFVRMRKR